MLSDTWDWGIAHDLDLLTEGKAKAGLCMCEMSVGMQKGLGLQLGKGCQGAEHMVGLKRVR